MLSRDTHARSPLAAGVQIVFHLHEQLNLAALGTVTARVFPAGSFKESGTNVATRLVRIEK